MKGYKEKSFGERMNSAAEAKKATLHRILARPGADDPSVIAQKADRAAVVAAREARVTARNDAKRAAEERARVETAARVAREHKEAVEKAAADKIKAATLAVEQKAARDARYAARKARK